MTSVVRGLVAAVAVAATLTPAAALAADPTVVLRVEGGTGTLVPPAAVTAGSTPVTKTDPETGATRACPGRTIGTALEAATAGDWGGRHDGQGQRLETVRGETHLLGQEFAGVFWSVWINDKPSFYGVCQADATLQEGDGVLVYAACAGATTGCFTDPLDISTPREVRPGEPFTVAVDELDPDYDTGTARRTPAAGAAVSGGDQAATTDAGGRATLVLSPRGPRRVQATKGSRVPGTAIVCVSDGADGFCGHPTPAGELVPGGSAEEALGHGAPAAGAAASCPTNGRDGRCGTRDRDPARAFVTSIDEGQLFGRGRGPRELRGAIGQLAGGATTRAALRLQSSGDPSGLHMVKLRLTRNHRGRCSWFSGRSERFRRMRCGARHGSWFAIGDRAEWRYLLPGRLPRGRYVLDVNAIDKAYNRDDGRRRGQNRVVFRVR